MRWIDHLERINDPVYVCRSLPFVSGAEDVEDLIAAMEAMQVALIGFAGFVLQPPQPGERNFLERTPNHWLGLIFVALCFVPQIGQGCLAIHESVDRPKIEDCSAFQANRVDMDVAIAAIIARNSLDGQRNGEAIVRIDVGSPLLLRWLFRSRMFFGYTRADQEKG